MVNGVQRVVKLIPASCGNYRVTQIYMTNVYKVSQCFKIEHTSKNNKEACNN